MTGKAPSWKSLSSIRIVKKQMEVLLDDVSNSGRSSRLLGFIDIGVSYEVVKRPFVEKDSKSHTWAIDNDRRSLLIEIKSAWPTVGNLIRQLNLYSACVPRGFSGACDYLLVGPDDSMNEIAQAHGYRLATYDSTATHFKLAKKLAAKPAPNEGTF
ncbi:MAG: hypothetical protein NVSMB34_09390 [Variovorax sp.]